MAIERIYETPQEATEAVASLLMFTNVLKHLNYFPAEHKNEVLERWMPTYKRIILSAIYEGADMADATLIAVAESKPEEKQSCFETYRSYLDENQQQSLAREYGLRI